MILTCVIDFAITAGVMLAQFGALGRVDLAALLTAAFFTEKHDQIH